MFNAKLYKYTSKYIQNGGTICITPQINNIKINLVVVINDSTLEITIDRMKHTYHTNTDVLPIINGYTNIHFYTTENKELPQFAVKMSIASEEYEDTLNDDFIALCYLQNESDDCSNLEWMTEPKNNIASNPCSNYIINSYMIPQISTNPKMIIMPYAEGSLLQYNETYNKSKTVTDDIIIILYKVALGLQCLIEKDLYYMDLKAENILYKTDKTECIDIVFGDIGSAFHISSKTTRMTFPPPNADVYYKQKVIEPVKDSMLECVIWAYEILILQLLLTKGVEKYKYDKIIFSNPYATEQETTIDMYQDDIDKVEELLNKNKNKYKDLIIQLLKFYLEDTYEESEEIEYNIKGLIKIFETNEVIKQYNT